ncbi:aspartate/glutamate racemase family protein [Tateyamaria pelophila]|uniref:aspartate/glutamate racemase family protein n=1 Tax=Tateyamaria pelophila TaxID=328415 RepID=UPI001CBF703E|nr:aspartate/glutamate racemase family protein [Tateyamaria pelophila]
MRLLVVNPNTSEDVTARIRAAALAAAEPGEHVTTITAASGPRLIVTEADGERAVQGVIEAIRLFADPFDGVVLASFGDTGAAAVRDLYPDIPVRGIAEAVFGDIKAFGKPFSIVTFAPELVPSLRHMAERHGVSDLLMEVAAVPGPLTHAAGEVADALAEHMSVLCRACAANGAQSIVLGGGPLAGLAHRIQPGCPVPVIDSTQSAIKQLRHIHRATSV